MGAIFPFENPRALREWTLACQGQPEVSNRALVHAWDTGLCLLRATLDTQHTILHDIIRITIA